MDTLLFTPHQRYLIRARYWSRQKEAFVTIEATGEVVRVIPDRAVFFHFADEKVYAQTTPGDLRAEDVLPFKSIGLHPAEIISAEAIGD